MFLKVFLLIILENSLKAYVIVRNWLFFQKCELTSLTNIWNRDNLIQALKNFKILTFAQDIESDENKEIQCQMLIPKNSAGVLDEFGSKIADRLDQVQRNIAGKRELLRQLTSPIISQKFEHLLVFSCAIIKIQALISKNK